MYLQKIFECLEEKLAEKDYLLEVYRKENQELHDQVLELREKMKEAGLK